jgi:hypothetical protein
MKKTGSSIAFSALDLVAVSAPLRFNQFASLGVLGG